MRRSPNAIRAFLLGINYDTGRWFYFPLAFLIKATLGFLALLAISPFLRPLWRKRREVIFLLVPAALYFGVSLLSTMNIGIRHILPVFPFLIVVAAAAAVALSGRPVGARFWRARWSLLMWRRRPQHFPITFHMRMKPGAVLR